MVLVLKDDHQSNSTPKLTSFKLPCKTTTKGPPLTTITMLTPPLRPAASIPFRWEEAPGKPRATTADGGDAPPPAKSNVMRSLELPPRLLASMHEEYSGGGGKTSNKIPSPTTVLDGPYVGRSMSLACTLSFRKGSTVAFIKDDDVWPAKGISGIVKFGSGRWEGFNKEVDYYGKCGSCCSSEISRTTLGDMMRSEEDHYVVKVTRVSRRRSFFFGLSTNKFKMLEGICASFKQAVAWRA